MDFSSTVEIALFVLSAIFVLVGYLLRKKDEQQAHDIYLLFRKHDEDVEELNNLKLKIAENHYHKRELDDRFAKLDDTFREVGRRLETKFDNLQESLLHFVQQNQSKGGQ